MTLTSLLRPGADVDRAFTLQTTDAGIMSSSMTRPAGPATSRSGAVWAGPS